MKILAGIYADTITVRKIEQGGFVEYIAEGTYGTINEFKESLDKVLLEADVDTNKIITLEEVFNLTRKIYEKYTQ